MPLLALPLSWLARAKFAGGGSFCRLTNETLRFKPLTFSLTRWQTRESDEAEVTILSDQTLSMKTARALLFLALLIVWSSNGALAETRRVPENYQTIQSAINESQPGDIVLVSPGTYLEHVQLAPGITLRSTGEKTQAKDSQRSKSTIIDGGKSAGRPGVVMAEGSTLDGFTITNVGRYDETVWKQHFDTQGQLLGDDEGSTQDNSTYAAVSIHGVDCRVVSCIVHHNGDVGIGIVGDKRSNIAPLIKNNIVFRNMGGGIGVAQNAEPIIRGNICRENMRSGIGCRNANPSNSYRTKTPMNYFKWTEKSCMPSATT